MANTYPQTGSRIDNEDGSNRTGVHLSTNIIIEVDGNAIGALQTLTIKEDRSIIQIDEIGTDGHVDSAPQKSTNITGSCQRTRFDGLRIAAAFSRPFVHAKSQRIPFDILIKDLFASTGQDDNTVLITTIKNVWISNISHTYKSDNFIIVEDMNWEAETIYSTINNSNVAGATANARQLILQDNNVFEKDTDRGRRRGALDAAGILIGALNA